MIIDWIPLSNASMTAENSDTPQIFGCVAFSMLFANCAKISEILLAAFLFAGRLFVACERYACWSRSVSHCSNLTDSSFFLERAFTIKDEPAPPQIAMGNLFDATGGSMRSEEH